MRNLAAVIRHRPRLTVLTVCGLAVVGGFGADRALRTEPTATAVPLPVYEIEATSGTHHASLLNLPLGQPGVAQVPTPVDVDGDLLPDVTVAANLINVDGLFHNPPEPGAVIAPNLVINRLPTAPLLGQASPPLRINAKVTIRDLEGTEPDTFLRVGYDTGPGGTIPNFYRVVVGGLAQFFDPLEVVVDTTGGALGLHTGIEDYAPTHVDDPYQGPLVVVGGIEQADKDARFDFAYRPFPRTARITYGTDAAGQHIGYSHAFADEVDLTSTMRIAAGPTVTDLTARVDRLPRALSLDLALGEGTGTLRYQARRDGRLPDIGVDLARHAPEQRPLAASLVIEAMPPDVSAAWSLPDKGPARVTLDAPGAGIGALEADIRNYEGAGAAGLVPIVPAQRQYVDFQATPGGAGDQLIRARVERLRHLALDLAPGRIATVADAGDGELPLELHYFRRPATGKQVDTRTTISPLPLHVEATVLTDDAPGAEVPLDARYTASDSIDVDTHIELRDVANPTEICGTGKTICADLALRYLPAELTARIRKLGNDMRVQLDSVPRTGALPPDAFADVVLGPTALQGDDPTVPAGVDPVVAHAELLGLPPHALIRMIKPPTGPMQRVEFHGCDWVVDGNNGACRTGTAGSIGEVRFDVRNRLDRPAALPRLRSSLDQFVTVAAEGTAFEMTGRVLRISEIQFAKREGGLIGVRTALGDGKRDLQAIIDMRRVDLDATDPLNPIASVRADAVVSPLPPTLDVCFRPTTDPAGEPFVPFTARCQAAEPFPTPPAVPAKTPLTVAYDAGTKPFVVRTDVSLTKHDVPLADGAGAPVGDSRLEARINIDAVPNWLVAHAAMPDKGENGPVRLRYESGQSATPIKADLDIRLLEDDLTCQDGRDGLTAGLDSLCFRARIENLPTTADVFYQDPKRTGLAANDPTRLQAENLRITTSGTAKMNVRDLVLSTVSADFEKQPDGSNKYVLSRLVAEGSLVGLPVQIAGRVDLPAGFSVHTPDDSPLDELNLTVRNFIAPDPLPVPPARPAWVPVTPSQQVEVVKHGDQFRARALGIKQVRSAGYESAVARDKLDPLTGGALLLDTKTASLDFGGGAPIRVFVDIEDVPQSGVGLDRTIADVTLDQLPSRGIDLCFRGARKIREVRAGSPVFCDLRDSAAATGTAPDSHDDQSAFQFMGRPGSAAGTDLDAYGFLRLASAGGADVVAARFEIRNIPFRVEGVVGGGRVKLDGFDRDNAPDGIDVVKFEVADADLAEPGYAKPYLWGDDRRHTGLRELTPFSQLQPGVDQYIQGAIDDDDFHLVGAVGVEEGGGQAGADLQSLVVDTVRRPGKNEPAPELQPQRCERPTPTPDDYPHYPEVTREFPGVDEATEYTCVRARFEKVGSGGGGNATRPLGVDLTIDDGNERIAVRDAGLTTLPERIDLVLADSPAQEVSTKLRTPCGSHVATAADADCVPPVLRVDSSGGAHLYGIIETGRLSDLGQLASLKPVYPSVDFGAAPGPAGWADWGPSGEGARLTLGSFDSAKDCEVPGAGGRDPRSALRVSLRLAIPQSLTVDPPQDWSAVEPKDKHCFKASDLRFRIVARNANGVIGTIGEFAGLIHNFRTGGQVVLTRPGEDGRGVVMPGELGFAMYGREILVPKGVRINQQASDFLQLDARTNTEVNLHARIRKLVLATNRTFLDTPDYTQDLDLTIRRLAAYDSPGTDPLAPSFRLKFEARENKTDKNPCTFFLCVEGDVRMRTVRAEIDLAGAHRVEAVLSDDSPEFGFQVKGFDAVTGGNPKEISGNVFLRFDPFNLFVHGGLPVAASFDMLLHATLEAAIKIDRAHDFTARLNLLRVKVTHHGSGTDSTVKVSFDPSFLLGTAISILGVFIGSPLLYLAFWIPTEELADFGGNAKLAFLPCDFDVTTAGINTIKIDPNETTDVFGSLHLDPRFVTAGVLKVALGLWEKLLFGVFCAAPTSLPLIADGHPAPPIGSDHLPALAFHPVPQAPQKDQPAPPAPPAPATLVVEANKVEERFCGAHTFAAVDVKKDGLLRPATVAGPTCRAEDVGSLTVSAVVVAGKADSGKVSIAGRLEGAPGSDRKVAISAQNVTVTSTGVVAASRGRLNLVAKDDLKVDGVVSADGVSTDTAFATQQGAGGSHGGKGGAGGGVFSAAPAEGDLTTTRAETGPDTGEVPTEAGARGGDTAGPDAPGNGGGRLALAGDRVLIGGRVSADGAGASGPVEGNCAGKDPNNPVPNKGTLGAGGGSGGGIVVTGRVVDVSAGGTIRAHGGPGGDSFQNGGGGGGGGIVKLLAPVLRGALPTVSGGGGGHTRCPDDGFGPGGDGQGGKLVDPADPASQADVPPNGFWQRASGLTVPYRAGAGAVPGARMQVVLCASFATQIDPKQTGFGILMPVDGFPAGTKALDHPCGAFGNLFHRVNTVTVSAEESVGTIGVPAGVSLHSLNGFVGLFTRTFEPGGLGDPTNDCFDHSDFKKGKFLGADFDDGVLYDDLDCRVEPLGTTPDVVVGMDNTAPEIDGRVLPAKDGNGEVVKKVGAQDLPYVRTPDPGGRNFIEVSKIADALSGLGSGVECSNDETTWVGCGGAAVGVAPFTIEGTSGLQLVHIRVRDAAGNEKRKSLPLVLDNEPPLSRPEVTPAVGPNGWYTSVPNVRILDVVDPGYPSPPLFGDIEGSGPRQQANPPHVQPIDWWFDQADPALVTPTPCIDPCTVTPVPTFGVHELRWQGVDRVGNHEVSGPVLLRIDDKPPSSAVLTVPSAPDGANGWFTRRPLVTFSAVDQPGGSGFVHGDKDLVKDAGVYYTLKTDGVVVVTDQKFTQPFPLGPGKHEVCWFAKDVAGNPSAPQCTASEIKVDDAAPVATIVTTPGAPDGSGGWFVTTPLAIADGTDTASGFDPAIDRATLCDTRLGPVFPTAAARPSGVCLSVDGAPFRPVSGAVTITEGRHVLRAFAIDASGQRSVLVVRDVLVDLSAPVSSARLVPPDPARRGWWRTLPTVVLRSVDGDQNAGVAAIEYRLGSSGAFTPYTGPFGLPSGVNVVQYRGRDGAGRVEVTRTLTVPVDVKPPTVTATTPSPVVFVPLLEVLGAIGIPNPPAKLQWTVADDLSSKVHVYVLVHNATGAVVRRLDAGEVTVTPGVVTSGHVAWDGKDATLTGLVPVGAYYYRAVAIDEAGNIAHSGESKPIQVKLG